MPEQIVNLKLTRDALVGGKVLPKGSVFQASGRLASEHLKAGSAVPHQVPAKIECAVGPRQK